MRLHWRLRALARPPHLVSVILIADDNPHAHRMGGQILSQEGHDVVTVANGDEAMAYLSENRPDLVMADTRMPGPNGFELCRHVKSAESLAGVKVVLLAGPLEPFDPAQAESAGCDSVLHKPLDAYSLIETVNSLIGKPEPVGHDEETPVAEATAETADDASDESGAPSSPDTGTEPAVAPAPLSPVAMAMDDPFAALVSEALGSGAPAAEDRERRVREAVSEVLEASLPALIDTLTARVLERLDADDD